MTRPTDQGTVFEEHIVPTPENTGEPTLEQLVSGTRELYAQATAQFRDLGELAFMELELAIKSLQWGILALLMIGASSILAFTFLMVAVVLTLKDSSVSPAVVMLICSGFSAFAACLLYLCLRSLTKKMTFSNLRSHLTQPQGEKRVKP